MYKHFFKRLLDVLISLIALPFVFLTIIIFGPNNRESGNNSGMINLPAAHGQTTDADADAPLGAGVLLLIGFGASYALRKKNNK